MKKPKKNNCSVRVWASEGGGRGHGIHFRYLGATVANRTKDLPLYALLNRSGLLDKLAISSFVYDNSVTKG